MIIHEDRIFGMSANDNTFEIIYSDIFRLISMLGIIVLAIFNKAENRITVTVNKKKLR